MISPLATALTSVSLQEAKEMMSMCQKFGVFTRRKLIARPWQSDGDFLDYASGMRPQNNDPISEVDGLFKIVGDKHNGHFAFSSKSRYLVLQLLACDCIQRPERFIHQPDFRPLRERASNLNALLHSTRQLIGILIRNRLQTHDL
jgi:hypothetical protein